MTDPQGQTSVSLHIIQTMDLKGVAVGAREDATEPCGTLSIVCIQRSSFSTPTFSDFWIRRMILRSPIRCSTKRASYSPLKVSCWLRPGRNP